LLHPHLQSRYVKHEFQSRYKSTVGADFLTKELFLGHNRHATVQLWDTAGHERFKGLHTVFFRGADGCILVYDITDETSFNDLHMWWDAFLQQNVVLDSNIPFLLIGNKLDKIVDTQSEDKSSDKITVKGHINSMSDGIIPESGSEKKSKLSSPGLSPSPSTQSLTERIASEKPVSKRRAVAWANEHQCIAFYETSARDGSNVDVAVNELCRYIMHKREEEAITAKPVKFSNDSIILDEYTKSKVFTKKDDDCLSCT